MKHSWPPGRNNSRLAWCGSLWHAAFALALLVPVAPSATAQAARSRYLASTQAQAVQAAGVQIAGDVQVSNGAMQLGSGSTITAGAETLPLTLTRGGELRLCATTTLHLAHDRSIEAADDTGLMLGLDRGALETHYVTGRYSDVLLTPDLRILISGPGTANLSVRVNQRGDTCVDNPGAEAPYITVTSPLEGGLYRVQPGQHVLFEHGSLREVVDHESEPCGCPAPVTSPLPVAAAGTPHAAGGPSSTPSDTRFPLAVSEGLAAPPGPPTTPVAAPGEVHAQVAVPFHYNGSGAPAGPGPGGGAAAPPSQGPPAAAAPAQAATMEPQAPVPGAPVGTGVKAGVGAVPAASASTVTATLPSVPPEHAPAASPGLFRRVGRFFAHLFGAEG